MFIEYISKVKGSVSEAIGELQRASFKNQSLLAILFALIRFGLIFLLMLTGFKQLSNIKNNPDFLANPQSIFEYLPTNSFGIIIISMIVFLFITSLYIAIGLNINDNIVKNNNYTVLDSLKERLMPKTINIFLSFFIFAFGYILILIILTSLAAAISKISPVLGILLAILSFIALFIGFFRLCAVPAYIVHGNYNVIDAIKLSIKRITWLRAIIILVLNIVFTILLAILYFIIFYATGTMLNGTISMILFFSIGVLVATIIMSCMSTIYFRYETDDFEDSIEKHLLADYDN